MTEQTESAIPKKRFITIRSWILLLAAVLLAAFAWAVPSFTNEWEGPGAINEKLTPYCDFWDYAQMGRQLVRGEGFTSLFTYPINLTADTIELKRGEAPDNIQYDNFWRPPLFPLMTAGIFKFNNIDFSKADKTNLNIYEKTNRVVLNFLGLWFILCVILTFFLARIWFGDQVAVISAFIVAVSPSLLEYTWGGYPAPVFTAFILGMFILLSYRNKYLLIPAGIIFGFGYLLRTNILFLIPAIFVLRWRIHNQPVSDLSIEEDEGTTDKKCKPVSSALSDISLVFALGMIVSIPWLLRNIAMAGNPTYNMSNYLPVMFTPDYPGWILFRTPVEPFSPFGYMLTHPLTMLFKAVKFTAWYIIRWPGLLGWPVTIVWIISLFMIPKDYRGRTIYIFALTALIFHFLPMILLEDSLRFFVPLSPLLIIMVSSVIYKIGNKYFQGKEGFAKNAIVSVAYAILGTLILIPIAVEFYHSGKSRTENKVDLHEVNYLNSNSHLIAPLSIINTEVPEAKGVILTDVADMVAWYCDRTAVWLPVHEAIGSDVLPLNMIEAIYVSPSILGLRPEPDVLKWREYFREDKEISGFIRVKHLSRDHGLLYIREDLLKFASSETGKDGEE